MDQIPEVVDQTLQVLADRFGTTGIHLWGILVRQVYVNAVTAMSVFLLVSAGVALTGRQAVASWRDPIGASASGFYAVVGILLALAWLGVLVWVLATIPLVINPEYSALTTILDALD